MKPTEKQVKYITDMQSSLGYKQSVPETVQQATVLIDKLKRIKRIRQTRGRKNLKSLNVPTVYRKPGKVTVRTASPEELESMRKKKKNV